MRKFFAAILSVIMVLSGTCVMAEGIEVEENLFSVEITLPADLFEEENTQENWDTSVLEGKCKSATVNEDGSVTIVMSKKQHQELLEETRASINASLVELVETNEEASFVSVEANENFTEFTATLSSDTVGLMESFSTLAFYMYGAMYHAFAGITVENISVAFINQTTGEVIETYNSADMGF